MEDSDTEVGGGGIDVEEAKRRMQKEDRLDRQNERKRIRAKHKELKRKEREERIAMTTVKGYFLVFGF